MKFKLTLTVFIMAFVLVSSASFAYAKNGGDDNGYGDNSSSSEGKFNPNKGFDFSKMKSLLKQKGEKSGQKDFSIPENVDTACVIEAIKTRDASLKTLRTSTNSSVESAIDTRSSAVLSAWGLSSKDAIKTALQAANKAFKDSTKTIREKAGTDRKTAMTTFRDKMKTCNPSGGSLGEDSSFDPEMVI